MTNSMQSHDLRLLQAKALWNKGWGKKLGYRSFEDYLATVPMVPEWPKEWLERFDRIILVDARLALTKACRLLGIRFSGVDDTFMDTVAEPREKKVYWIRCQDGRNQPFRSKEECYGVLFAPYEVGLAAFEGLSLFAQDATVLRGHHIALLSSTHVTLYPIGPEIAHLIPGRGKFWSRKPRLDWLWSEEFGDTIPYPGAASRGGRHG